MHSEDSATRDRAMALPGAAVAFWQVDAFTAEPWRGNPAGVCVLDAAAPETWMQAVAADVNVAETAFVHPSAEPVDGAVGTWELRWFTPATEVDLCGHATLAAAHVLHSARRVEGPMAFRTRSGVLRARTTGAQVELDFPAQPPAPASLPAVVGDALGAPVRWAGWSAPNWLVELDDAAAVRALGPDIPALADCGAQGVIVTAPTSRDGRDEASDFVSRYFAPAVGIAEDPVTGSAHCALGPYWAGRLGRDDLVGRQVSRRGGWVGVRVVGERVLLTGSAVTVMGGTVLGPGQT